MPAAKLVTLPRVDSPISAAPAESRALTGLRGVASLWVVAHHMLLGPLQGVGLGAFDALVRHGYFAVDLFFVLSGFVLAMVHGPWFEHRIPPRLAALFLVRRVARLWPLHLVALALVVATGAHGLQHVSWRSFAANAAMIQAWGPSVSINAPSWSASTEFLAALLFPALALLVLGSRLGAIAALALAAGLLTVAVELAPVGLMRRGPLDIYFNYSPLAAFRCLAGTLVGLVAWRCHRFVLPRWSAPAAILATLAVLWAGLPDLLAYPLLPVIVLALHQGRGDVMRWLTSGPVHRLGVLSYAIYLMHEPMLVLFPFGRMPFWAGLPLYLALVLAVASFAHVVVERPARAALRSAGERVIAAIRP